MIKWCCSRHIFTNLIIVYPYPFTCSLDNTRIVHNNDEHSMNGQHEITIIYLMGIKYVIKL